MKTLQELESERQSLFLNAESRLLRLAQLVLKYGHPLPEYGSSRANQRRMTLDCGVIAQADLRETAMDDKARYGNIYLTLETAKYIIASVSWSYAKTGHLKVEYTRNMLDKNLFVSQSAYARGITDDIDATIDRYDRAELEASQKVEEDGASELMSLLTNGRPKVVRK